MKAPTPAKPSIIYRVRATDEGNGIWEFTTIDRKRALNVFELFSRDSKLRSAAIVCGSQLYEAHMLERLP